MNFKQRKRDHREKNPGYLNKSSKSLHFKTINTLYESL